MTNLEEEIPEEEGANKFKFSKSSLYNNKIQMKEINDGQKNWLNNVAYINHIEYGNEAFEIKTKDLLVQKRRGNQVFFRM